MRKTIIAALAVAATLSLGACTVPEEATKTSAAKVAGATTSAPADTPADDSSSGEDASVAKVGAEGFTYKTGLKVTIPSLSRYKPGQYAVGLNAGQVGVLLTVKIVNGSTEPVDMALTTVNLRAGADGNEAEMIADMEKGIGSGFSGKVAPGRSASAKFAFAVNKADLGQIDVEVSPGFLDYDSVLFSGSAK